MSDDTDFSGWIGRSITCEDRASSRLLAEYRATLRDLLGLDPAKIDLAAKLPTDDTGYGFDNIADVLSTSPLAVEQYLDAAEHAIDAALGPVIEIGDHPRDLRPLEGTSGQALPRGY